MPGYYLADILSWYWLQVTVTSDPNYLDSTFNKIHSTPQLLSQNYQNTQMYIVNKSYTCIRTLFIHDIFLRQDKKSILSNLNTNIWKHTYLGTVLDWGNEQEKTRDISVDNSLWKMLITRNYILQWNNLLLSNWDHSAWPTCVEVHKSLNVT